MENSVSVFENLKVLDYVERIGKVHIELDEGGSTIVGVTAENDWSVLIVPDFIKAVDLSQADHEAMYGINRVVVHGELDSLDFLKELEFLEWVEIVNSDNYLSIHGVVYDDLLNLKFVPPHLNTPYLKLLDTVKRIPSTVSFGFAQIGVLVLPHVMVTEADVFSGSAIKNIVAPELKFMGTIKDMPELEHIEADPMCIYERIERCPALIK